MKKYLSIVLAVMVVLLGLSACGKKQPEEERSTTSTSESTEPTSDLPTDEQALSTIVSTTKITTLTQSQKNVTDIKAGFIFHTDKNSDLDNDFMEAAVKACMEMGVKRIKRFSIDESNACLKVAAELVNENCSIIFADKFIREDFVIQAAKKYPEVQFVHESGLQAQTQELSNYHNAYASTEQGSYLTGIAAGMKMNEMINEGRICAEDAKMGFVGTYTYAEVISYYTAFYLGAKSACPSVTMEVQFTGSWYDENAEKDAATKLINNGCKLLSQCSDSLGVPYICEYNGIPNVPYNGSTASFCPNTYIVSSEINWEPILKYFIMCLKSGKSIGYDYCGSLSDGSLSISNINSIVAAKGTQSKINSVKKSLIDNELHIFDTAKFTVNGKTVKSNAITDAHYFDLRIDGITLLNEK